MSKRNNSSLEKSVQTLRDLAAAVKEIFKQGFTVNNLQPVPVRISKNYSSRTRRTPR